MIMACKLDHIHPVQKILLKINGVHQIGSMETSFLPWLPNCVYLKTKSQKQCACCSGIYSEQQRNELRTMIRSRGRLSVHLKKPHPRRFQRHGILEKAKVYGQKKTSGCQGAHGAVRWLSTGLWWPVPVTYLCPVPRMYSPRWLLLWTLDFWSYWCVKVASSIVKDVASSRDADNGEKLCAWGNGSAGTPCVLLSSYIWT